MRTWLVLLLSAGGDLAIAAVLMSLGYLIPALIVLAAAIGVAGFAMVLRSRE